MPQPFKNAVITNSGIDLLTRAQAGKVKIEFTRILVGNGIYTEDEKAMESMRECKELKSPKNSYPLSDISVVDTHSVKVTTLITNQDSVTGQVLVDDGYYVNEIGLYAKEKDGDDSTELLYSIAVTSGNNGDFMPPYNGYNPAQITQDYYVTVSDSMEVIIQTNGAPAMAEDLREMQESLKNCMEKVNAEIESIDENVREQMLDLQETVFKESKTAQEMQHDMLRMAMVIATMTDADALDSCYAAVEIFRDTDDVIVRSGGFDAKNKCVYA